MEIEIQRTCSFKIPLSKENLYHWDNHFHEFSNAVNGYIKFFSQTWGQFNFIPKKEQFDGNCIVCNDKKKIVHMSKDSMEKYCSSCFNSIYGISKIYQKFYPARGRKVNPSKNIKNYARLTGSEFSMANEVAKGIMKSQTKRKTREEFLLKKITFRLNKFIELRDGGKNRVIISPPTKRHKERYAYKLDIDEGFNFSYTMAKVHKNVSDLEKQIKRIKKRKSSLPKFGTDKMMLHKNSIKVLDNEIEVALGGRKFSFKIIGDYQKEMFEKIKKSDKIPYPSIVKKKGQYFLDYPVSEKIEILEPNSSFKALGIDRGVKKILALSIIDEVDGVPHDVKLIAGGEFLDRRRIYEDKRKAMSGKKHSYRKIKKTAGKVSNYTKYKVHGITREVVNKARKLKPIVIVLEDLKYIRDTARKKTTKKLQKKENKMLSGFIYSMIEKNIVYKALMEGIPVVKVDARGTSQECNKCGFSDPKNRSRENIANFKCLECGYTANADYNASVNIARRFYRELENRKVVFDNAENIYRFTEKI